jgi:bis(5'-adenosyl)-triphosphatase
MQGCPFCEPLVNNSCFLQKGGFRAVYNLAPILPGHALVVPVKHIVSLNELNDSELAEFVVFSRLVTKVLVQAFGAEGFDWSLQDGAPAGQTVQHLHLHIVPRKPADLPQGNDWYTLIHENEPKMLDSSSREKLSRNEMDRMIALLKNAAILFL